MSDYEIYALKYAGPFFRTGAHLMWYRDWDKIDKINYYIWCIKGTGEIVIVDTGVTPQMAKDRELNEYVNPVEVLARININADEVRHVVVTHMHWDHAGGVSLFPRATFYVQENEYRFWLQNPVAGRPPFKQVADAAANTYLAAVEQLVRYHWCGPQELTEQQKIVNLQNTLNSQEAQFASQTPDYDAAKNHYFSTRFNSLQKLGYSPEQAQNQIAMETMQFSQTALNANENAASRLYDAAKESGYVPVTAKAEQKLATIQEGQEVGSMPKGASPKGELTLETLANMTDAEFASLSEEQIRSAMGG